MEQYILSMDAGTTSGRCILFDKNGQILHTAQKSLTQYYPRPGWVEQDADEIWQVQYETAQQVIAEAGIRPEQIAAIGITNQRETTIVWDRTTGKPVCPAIVWQCRRTSDYCEELHAAGYGPMIREKTGLLPDPYFSGSKIHWILEHVEDAREKAEKGDLLFGTVETWLIWKLTEGRVHVTDYSNASRTMLFNIHTLHWDEELLDLLDIPVSMLPKPVSSSELYGYSRDYGIPICGAAGDQQAALFGQACFEPGEAKCTYGTGGFLLMNTGSHPVTSENGLLTTIAASRPGRIQYALEGSIFIAGAVIQWLRDELGLISSAAESEVLASQVADTAGCYIVPAFTGLGAPHWDPLARGTITGLTRGVNRCHIVRAALESIALQIGDVLDAMSADCRSIDLTGSGKADPAASLLTDLRVDGGACANSFLMQFQADLLNVPILRPACLETTALGAAYLAGLAAGYWKNTEDLRSSREIDTVFSPHMTEQAREEKRSGWSEALRRTFSL